MAREKKSRALRCKKAAVTPASGTLQKMVGAALSRRKRAADRSEPTSEDPNGGAYRLIAQHYAFGGGIAGIFTSYERGSSALSIEPDPEATQINLAQLQPPSTQEGKRREWAEGLLYFFIRDDFVVMIQSSAVRQVQFEEHLSWLLKERGERVGPEVALADQPARSARDMVRRSHVKSVNFGGPLMMAAENTTAPTSSRHHDVRIIGPMLDAMKALLGSGDESFRWEDGLDGNIEAWLHLTYKRQTNEPAQRLLDKVGLAMRNVEGVDTELVLNNGEKIRHDQLRLMTKRHIHADDGVLVADAAFTAMMTWLDELLDSGHLR
ncbi:MAG: hypothetical protein Q7U97_14505 [Rhodocyclaceae bacterium]|nr:hypothetical protein [Rhodocyclaceae bacterium]